MADQALNVQPVIDWLIEGAPPARLPKDVLAEFCRRVREQGMALYRAAVFVRTLHPNVLGRSFIWQEGRDAVEVRATVNGESRQHGFVRDMMFAVPSLLAYVSRIMTLEPGDLLLTGTPSGVAPLRAGDRVEVSISGIGTLESRVVER